MITNENMQALLLKCNETERVELAAKHNAYIKHLQTYSKDPSKNNLQEFDAAKKSLYAMAQELAERDAAPPEESFPHLIAATQYLQGQGWKVAKSRVYKDARNGKLRVNGDRTVNQSELDAYAHKYLKKTEIIEYGKVEDLLKIEKECQVALLRAREAKITFENELARGQYLARDAVILEWCVKLGMLEAGLKNAIRSRAEEWLHEAGGSVDRAGDFYARITAEIDRLLGDMADLKEINVTVKKQPSRDGL